MGSQAPLQLGNPLWLPWYWYAKLAGEEPFA